MKTLSKEDFMRACGEEMKEMSKLDVDAGILLIVTMFSAGLVRRLFPVDKEEKLAEEILHDSDN